MPLGEYLALLLASTDHQGIGYQGIFIVQLQRIARLSVVYADINARTALGLELSCNACIR